MPQVRQAEAETAENAEVKEIFSRAAVHFDCKDRYSAEERERLNSIERTYISLKMGSNDLNINGNSVKMDAEPRYAEEKTMIPIRIVAEALGAKVDWDEAAQSVIVCDENTRICIPLSSYYAVIDNAWESGAQYPCIYCRRQNICAVKIRFGNSGGRGCVGQQNNDNNDTKVTLKKTGIRALTDSCFFIENLRIILWNDDKPKNKCYNIFIIPENALKGRMRCKNEF